MENRREAPICERGNDLIAFLYGEVNEHEARDFEWHLRNCVECKLELGAFKQIRESVGAWRQEALGAAASVAGRAIVSPAVVRAYKPEKPSAIAAIRKLFELSPLWMKGSIAFASVLFCVLSVLAIARLLENSKPALASEDKRYTEKELQAKIDEALQSKLRDPEDQKSKLPSPSVVANNERQDKTHRTGTNRSTESAAASPKVGRRPLTKSEREQLAADLRLISPQDDTDLDLLGDRLNK